MEKPTLVPIFITASTKKDLVRKMLEINLKQNAHHKFFDIQKDGNEWVAWYFKDVLHG